MDDRAAYLYDEGAWERHEAENEALDRRADCSPEEHIYPLYDMDGSYYSPPVTPEMEMESLQSNCLDAVEAISYELIRAMLTRVPMRDCLKILKRFEVVVHEAEQAGCDSAQIGEAVTVAGDRAKADVKAANATSDTLPDALERLEQVATRYFRCVFSGYRVQEGALEEHSARVEDALKCARGLGATNEDIDRIWDRAEQAGRKVAEE